MACMQGTGPNAAGKNGKERRVSPVSPAKRRRKQRKEREEEEKQHESKRSAPRRAQAQGIARSAKRGGKEKTGAYMYIHTKHQ